MITSRSVAIIASSAVFIGLATGSVILRFYTRRRSSANIGLDDWLIVVAWVMALGHAITNIVGATVGHIGTSFEQLSESETSVSLKVLFVFQFWYIAAVTVVKLSILALYRRVFAVTQTPLVFKVLAALTVAWFISFFFATLFQILPIYCNWTACDPTSDYSVMYILSSVTDILLDIAILACPAFFLRHLHISLHRKIVLGLVFALGMFCIVASLARLVYTVGFFEIDVGGSVASDFDTVVDYLITWSCIEACWSITCASLPVYSSLIFGSTRLKLFGSSISSFGSRGGTTADPSPAFKGTWSRTKSDRKGGQSTNATKQPSVDHANSVNPDGDRNPATDLFEIAEIGNKSS